MGTETPRRLRVVHVFGSMEVGGAELRTLDVMESLSDVVEAHYIALSGRAGSLEARIRAAGGSVHELPLGGAFAAQLVALLRRERFDVVHSHVATFSGVILAAARAAAVPNRIAHFRSDSDGKGNSLRRRIQRATMRFLIRRCATAIVGVTPGALHGGYGRGAGLDARCRVIPNGYWFPEESPLPLGIRSSLLVTSASPLLMHVGRPSGEKNRERLPRLLRAVVDAGVPAHLVAVGPRDEILDRRLMHVAQTFAVEDRIHLWGPTSEVSRALVEADVLVLTSLREGLPGVVVEARANGVPVVSSDLPGARFINEHLGRVTTLSLGTSDVEWALAIRSAIRDGRDPYSTANARFRDSIFALEHAVGQFAELYRLERHPSCSSS